MSHTQAQQVAVDWRLLLEQLVLITKALMESAYVPYACAHVKSENQA